MKNFRFVMAFVFCLSASRALTQSFDGIYTGSMHLVDEEVRDVPLAVSLAFTGEEVTAPNGEQRQVIDGAFVIDEEGGPYSFSKVSLDIDDARLDMRYNRPQLNLSNELPSSWRLVGYLEGDGKIAGRVLSGNRGQIGTFELSHSELSTLPIRKKYSGAWEGVADLTTGGQMPFRIVLAEGQKTYTNPLDFELDFTPGKIAYMKWNASKFDINEVAIDYLRQKVYLFKNSSGGGPGLSVQFKMDFQSQSVVGEIDSVLRGKTATFTLSTMKQ